MKEENVRKKEESVEKKRRKQIFIYIIIAILSVVAVYFLTTYILTITKVINQGYFRINDFVVTSMVEVTESTEEESENVSEESDDNASEIENELNESKDFKLNVSQINKFSILVPFAEEAKIEKVYLSDISSSNKDIYLSASEESENLKLADITENIDVNCVEKDNQYYIEFSLKNQNVLENAKVPDDVNAIVYDGTILKVFNYDVNLLKYTFRAKLNIVDNYSRTSYCDINITLPIGDLGENGIVIERENIEEYTLKLKSKYLQF